MSATMMSSILIVFTITGFIISDITKHKVFQYRMELIREGKWPLLQHYSEKAMFWAFLTNVNLDKYFYNERWS